jgi:hypothetical protein
MRALDHLLVALTDLVPVGVGSKADDLFLHVRTLDLTLPVEARIESGGQLQASLPRGRLATGFDPRLARIHARFEVREA